MTSTSYFYIDFTQSGAVCKNSYMSYEGQDWVLQQVPSLISVNDHNSDYFLVYQFRSSLSLPLSTLKAADISMAKSNLNTSAPLQVSTKC